MSTTPAPHDWITAADGTRLAAIWHTPASDPRGAVLIAPAMGVPQSFYQPGVRPANRHRPLWPASVCTAPASNQREPAVELTLLGLFRRVNSKNAGQIGQFGRS